MLKKALGISFAVIICVGFLTTLSLAAVDISGTWEGSTEVPDIGVDDFTLVFEKTETGYSGLMSDQLGMMENVACEDILIEGDKLTFHVEFYDGMEYTTVYLTFTVSQDELKGNWEAGGNYGEINFARKK
jgi:hypothetical protein